jgi:non-homologous end joining protein Ku
MARAMWKGSIAFGLVNIPIELYSAVRDHRPRFRLLHAKDEAPVKFERVCINAKLKGKRPRLQEMESTPQQAEVVDLMARLRASLEGKKAAKAHESRRNSTASKTRKGGRTQKRHVA